MRRVVNFRPCLVILLFCATGIILMLVAFNIAPLGIALLSGLFILLITLTIVCSVLGKLNMTLTFAVAVCVTAAAVYLFYAAVTRPYPAESGSAEITGRITEYCEHTGSELVVTLDGLTIGGDEAAGRMTVTFTDDYGLLSYLNCGDGITFRASPSVQSIVDGMTVNTYSVRSDVLYYAYADESDVISTTEGAPSAMESVRIYMRDSLMRGMGEEFGGIAFGMIAGDRYAIPEEANSAFSVAGIGHILSVSGLHIALFAMALTRFLRFLRLPRLPRGLMVMAGLIVYAVFTGGAASAVRSLIMYSVSMWTRFFGRYDPLSSLSAACIICLLISPLYLFDCGFLMSAGAVFGLIAFSSPLVRLMFKAHLPRFLAFGLGSSLSVQIAILPLTAVFFSEIGLYSVIVNALLMPVLSALFIVIVALLPLLLIPPLAFLGFFPALGIAWIGALSAFVSSLPFAAVTVRVSALAVLVIPVSFPATRFVLIGNKYMRSVFTSLLCCALLMLGENGLHCTDAVVFLGGSSAVTVVLEQDTAALVADWSRGESVSSAISRSRLTSVSFDIYMLSLDYDTALELLAFSDSYTINSVILPPGADTTGSGVLTDIGTDIRVCSSYGALSAAYIDSSPRGWTCFAGDKLCFITDGVVSDEYLPFFDIVRGRAYYGYNSSVYAAFTENIPALAYGDCVIIA